MRARRLLLVIAAALILAGCWNRREIETLGFTLLAGVDYLAEEEMYEVSVQVVKTAAFAKEAPGGGAPAAKPYHVVAARGRTVFDAIRNITREANRKIWWGHNLIVVLGEATARRGIRPVLDWFARDGESRRLFWVVVTPGRARDVVTADVQAVRIPAMGLNEVIKVHRATSTAQAVRLHDLLRALSAPVAATAGKVEIVQGLMGPEFHYEGSAVFRADRLAGYLDARETRGMLWVTGKVKSGIVVIPCPRGRGEVGIEIIHTSARIRPDLDDGLAIAVEVKKEGHIGDQLCEEPLATVEDWWTMEAAEARVIRGEVEAALRRARALQADLFGFGARIYQEYPAEWKRLEKEWAERHFPRIPVHVQVEARIRRPGLITRMPPAK